MTDTRSGSVPEVDFEIPEAGTEEYTHWQKTGELELPPAEEKKIEDKKPEEKSEKPGESAAPPSEADKKPKAAAGPEPVKPGKKTAEARLQELLAERKQRTKAWDEERAKLLDTVKQLSDRRDTTAPAAAKPTEKKNEAKPRPQPGDKDEQGKAKYEKWGDYEAALQNWAFDEASRLAMAKVEERLASNDKQRQDSDTERQRQTAFAVRARETEKKFADFAQVAYNPIISIPKGSEFEAFILESDLGPEMAYYFGQNPEEAERISGWKYTGLDSKGEHNFQKTTNGLQGKALIRELTLIELSLLPDETEEGKKPAPAASKTGPKPLPKPVSAAPKPPHQVSGKASTSRDPAEAALDNDDPESVASYMNEMNSRDIARRKTRR